MTTACGKPLPPRAHREIGRLAERLGLVLRQVEAIEAERDTAVRAGAERADATIAPLTRLKGLGRNGAEGLAAARPG